MKKALCCALFAALAIIARCPAQNASAAASPAPGAQAAAAGPTVAIDFSNPGLSPSHWTLTLHPDGSGHFRSEMGDAPVPPGELRTPSVDRDVQLTPAFAASAFQTAQRHAWFHLDCESHLKVAFQGTKQLSYTGPEGSGSCTFNYSRDHDIQTLADSLSAVSETILAGVRLEMFLQHDPLGLNKEMEALSSAAQDGRAQQIGAIRAILERLAQDDRVLDLVRKRARFLLAHAGS